jgi:uncharacterized protein (TIGR03435 family)
MEIRRVSAGLLFWALPVLAQTVASSPTFEVASVRPAPPPSAGRVQSRIRSDAGRVEYSNVTLKDILARAYGVNNRQISGPGWLDAERYSVLAKVPDGAPSSQIPAMLQGLLLERFQMRVHKETKETDIYALVIGGGPTMTRAEDPRAGSASPSGSGTNASTPVPGGSFTAYRVPGNGRAGFRASAVTMARLSEFLASFVDRPAVNMTDLQGAYNFRLEFSFEILVGIRTAEGRRIEGSDGPAPDDDPAGSVFSGVQRLGLKLEARKAPLEHLVIDHAERVPKEN